MNNNHYISKLTYFIATLDNIISMFYDTKEQNNINSHLTKIVTEMQESIDASTDEIGQDYFQPAVYNAIATIKSVPPKLAVANQYKEALKDSQAEMLLILEEIKKL